MATSDRARIQDIHRKACARWPGVHWAPEAFEAFMADDGRAAAKHPQDLYLSGAAGHRVDEAWEVVDREMGPSACRVLQRQPVADYTVDELWRDTVAKLIDADSGRPPLPDGRPPARIIRYRGCIPLLNFFILAARRLAIQRFRQRRPVVELDGGGPDDRPVELQDPEAPSPDANALEQEAIRRLRPVLSGEYAQLSPEQQFLIAMVYRQGMTQKAAGAMLGWNESKTSRGLSAAMERLRGVLSEVAGVPWTPAMASAWAEILKECWKNIATPPGSGV